MAAATDIRAPDEDEGVTKFYYGGQAVIEGVMMRGRREAAVVVRTPNGELVSRHQVLPAALYERRLTKLPLVRGLVVLWEMLGLGTKMMLFSAGVQARRDPETEIPRQLVGAMLAVSLVFVVGLFFVVPLLLARASGHWVHSSLGSNALEGLVRFAVFIAYLAAVGRLGQMKRVFEYHGAEHKTINAYEAGEELTPVSVQRFSTIHVRCGTAFILWVLVVSIIVFALLGHPPLLVGIGARIILVPLIAAASYEILRLGARFYGVPVVRLVLQPGLWLQRLTTREPDDEQVAIAIAALKHVLSADGVVIPQIRPVSDAGVLPESSAVAT